MIYNVTVKIESAIESDWTQWMTEKHIPEVLETGLFKTASLRKILVDEPEPTFAIQYTCLSASSYEEYQSQHAQRLQQEHTLRYKDKFVVFRTLMEEIKEF